MAALGGNAHITYDIFKRIYFLLRTSLRYVIGIRRLFSRSSDATRRRVRHAVGIFFFIFLYSHTSHARYKRLKNIINRFRF